MNCAKLRGRVRELGLSQADIAKIIGVSEPTINAKLNARSEFTQSEMAKLCAALSIKEKDIPAYFFAQ